MVVLGPTWSYLVLLGRTWSLLGRYLVVPGRIWSIYFDIILALVTKWSIDLYELLFRKTSRGHGWKLFRLVNFSMHGNEITQKSPLWKLVQTCLIDFGHNTHWKEKENWKERKKMHINTKHKSKQKHFFVWVLLECTFCQYTFSIGNAEWRPEST